jgi:hypothetical protein
VRLCRQKDKWQEQQQYDQSGFLVHLCEYINNFPSGVKINR